MDIDKITLCDNCVQGRHSKHTPTCLDGEECDCDRCVDPEAWADKERRRDHQFRSPEARERRHAVLLAAASLWGNIDLRDNGHSKFSQTIDQAEKILAEIERRERDK